MFADAESQVANIRVRNQGTLGGNLCFNDPHSDPGTALLVHDTKISLREPSGERKFPLNEFLVGMYATALSPDELLEHVEVPRCLTDGAAHICACTGCNGRHWEWRPPPGRRMAASTAQAGCGMRRTAAGAAHGAGEKDSRPALSEAQRDVKMPSPILPRCCVRWTIFWAPPSTKSTSTAVLVGKALKKATENGGDRMTPESNELDTRQTRASYLDHQRKTVDRQGAVEETLLDFVRSRVG